MITSLFFIFIPIRSIEVLQHLRKLNNLGIKGNALVESEEMADQVLKLNHRIRIYNNKKIERKPRDPATFPKRQVENRKDKDYTQKKQKRENQGDHKNGNKVKEEVEPVREEEEEVKESKPVKNQVQSKTFEAIKEKIQEEAQEEQNQKKKKAREGILKIEKKNQNQKRTKLASKIESKRVQKVLRNEVETEGWD